VAEINNKKENEYIVIYNITSRKRKSGREESG
jgi:hypothetical protein